MLKIETSTNWARTCDICRASACSVYCRADAAYLCAGCDSEIHSANPLARRHHRVPILPIPEYAPHDFLNHLEASENVDDDEAASWLLLNPVKKNSQSTDNNNSNGVLFGGEVDQYLDLDGYNSSQTSQFSSDQYNNNHHHHQPQQNYSFPQKGKDLVQQQFFQLGLDDYETSNIDYNYPASLSQNVSFSSMEVGVVPESTMSEGSVSHSRPPKGTINLFSGSSPIQMPTQLSPVDREARVSRYREKKKMRKFEKTIRYASRKAYAETRPRIKGRFAKRTDGESEPGQTFSTSLNSEGAYGVVPSF